MLNYRIKQANYDMTLTGIDFYAEIWILATVLLAI